MWVARRLVPTASYDVALDCGPMRFWIAPPDGLATEAFEKDVKAVIAALNNNQPSDALAKFLVATEALEEFRPINDRDLQLAAASGVPVREFWEAWDALRETMK